MLFLVSTDQGRSTLSAKQSSRRLNDRQANFIKLSSRKPLLGTIVCVVTSGHPMILNSRKPNNWSDGSSPLAASPRISLKASVVTSLMSPYRISLQVFLPANSSRNAFRVIGLGRVSYSFAKWGFELIIITPSRIQPRFLMSAAAASASAFFFASSSALAASHFSPPRLKRRSWLKLIVLSPSSPGIHLKNSGVGN